MKYNFLLHDFPGIQFEMEMSVWTGKSKLFKDGVQLEQSKEKGKPFLIITKEGMLVKAFPKQALPDMVPSLQINGTIYPIAEKLTWYEYTIGGLPLLLILFGGLLGALIGGGSTMVCYNIFRQNGSGVSKYLKVSGVILVACLAYMSIAFFIVKLAE